MNKPARTSAVPTTQVDNERARVTLWRFAPGAATGFHRHEHDYCIVPLVSGKLEIEAPSGNTATDMTVGASYFRRAGVEHDVINVNAFDFAFVEIEFKEPPRGA